MLDLEERKDILNDEIEILEGKGWYVESRTDTTCFLIKEDNALGCLSMFVSFEALTPFFHKQIRTRTVEISPEGEIIRSWKQLY